MYGYKAVLEAARRGDTYEKGIIPETPLEYIAVKELLTEIGRALPELDGVVPCYIQSDHMNQLGALQCSECNPNDYQNW